MAVLQASYLVFILSAEELIPLKTHQFTNSESTPTTPLNRPNPYNYKCILQTDRCKPDIELLIVVHTTAQVSYFFYSIELAVHNVMFQDSEDFD